KAFGQEDREQERFVDRSRASSGARLRAAFGEGVFDLLVNTTTAFGTGAVLFIGVGHVQSGVLSLGDLLLVMGYLAQLYTPLQNLSKSVATLQASMASAERAFALLDQMPDVAEAPHARPLPHARGAVVLDHLSFAYEKG